MTDDLIDRLSSDLRPVDRKSVARRLTWAILIGGGAALVGMVLFLGLRPDFPQALGSSMFWVKAAYTGALGGLGFWVIERLARPGADARDRLPWLFAPVIAIGVLAAMQLSGAAPEGRHDLVMGNSATVCSWRIAVCAAPVFVALIWALRGLAPTRLRSAGAVAGLAAGGFGAAIYALHCPEVGAPFVGLWYSLGIVAPAILGAAIGPRILRW